MIVTRFATERVLYRCLTPRWSFQPLSGAGAASQGGRFNRPGVMALYLSTDQMTAIAEAQQDSSIAPPMTLAAYRVRADDIVDFSAGFDVTKWAPGWASWDCEWKAIARIDLRDPPTWILSDALIKAGRRGLLFPSTKRPGGINLVLFGTNITPSDRVEVHDPGGDLPIDQSSWPARSP